MEMLDSFMKKQSCHSTRSASVLSVCNPRSPSDGTEDVTDSSCQLTRAGCDKNGGNIIMTTIVFYFLILFYPLFIRTVACSVTVGNFTDIALSSLSALPLIMPNACEF